MLEIHSSLTKQPTTPTKVMPDCKPPWFFESDGKCIVTGLFIVVVSLSVFGEMSYFCNVKFFYIY